MKDSKKKSSKSPKKSKQDKKQTHKKSPNIPNMLGKLQDQIDQTTSEDEKGRALLRDLTADIKEHLEGLAKGERRPKESFLQRLRDAIDYFAVTHPTLTLALSYALTILSTAGI